MPVLTPRLSRRQLLGMGVASGMIPMGLLAGRSRRARADSTVPQQKFLFVFCPGGWDQLVVFCPIFNDKTDRHAEAEAATVSGLSFVDAELRPYVRTYMENWASRSLIVNGIQVPSVSHSVCRRLMMTGSPHTGSDDWCSILGGTATGDLPMPAIHIDGPVYPNEYLSALVRVGSAGQLPALLDGSALSDQSDVAVSAPDAAIEALQDAWLANRTSLVAASAPRGRLRRYAQAESAALARTARVTELASTLVVSSGTELDEKAKIVVDCLEQGVSRCGIIAFDGIVGGWDTHGSNIFQDENHNLLFGYLDTIVADLASRVGEAGGSLLDETTVVVLSEMGRVPLLNSAGGKDHWTWTSAMLVGAGIAGGRCVGSWNEDIEGEPIDLESGEASSSGEIPTGAHIGATLLAIAGEDPAEFIDPVTGKAILGALA